VNIEGVYTHFATSDHKDKTYALLQLSRFKSVVNQIKERNIKFGLIHAANSGAIIDIPEAYFDMVRPGIMLYGYSHYKDKTDIINLKPVMSLYSSVYSIKNIKKGQSVSYGRKFIAEKNTRIASVPIGYADGVVRELTNQIQCIINDQIFPQVGTITMDYIMFDISNADVKVGDKVIILGESGDLHINAWDWCKILDSIPYTTTCGISKRVPRKFIYKKT
jgi:alanine racemase